MSDSKTDAYHKGYEAAESGVWWDQNPYPPRSEHAQRWLWGWDDAPSVPQPKRDTPPRNHV